MTADRAIMKAQLYELKQLQAKLRLRIEGNCRAVRSGLNSVLVDRVDDLDIPMVAEQMDELQEAWGKLTVTNSRIAGLERELD